MYRMILSLMMFFVFNVAHAVDLTAAKNTATKVCAGCHGSNGTSPVSSFPNLAGQKETYIYMQLKAFRDKSRNMPIMNSVAANLKDDEMADLATYFAGLRACE